MLQTGVKIVPELNKMFQEFLFAQVEREIKAHHHHYFFRLLTTVYSAFR